jgi:hypothetical protein
MQEKEHNELAHLNIVPKISVKEVQEAANRAAMEGIKSALENFYTGYNSPFKKAIQESLEKEVPSFSFDLTGVMALLNESLVTIIDEVTNQAVAKSYIPLVRDLLTKTKDEIKVSEIVEKFISAYSDYGEEWDGDDFRAELKKDDLGWYNLHLEAIEEEVEFTIVIHKDFNRKNPDKYQIINIPIEKGYGNSFGNIKYSFTLDDGKTVKMEMPYGYGILKNDFIRFIANLVTFNTSIVIDTDNFDDILYP